MSDNIIKTGGAAFPIGTHRGMTLRDYFAAKAMQQLIQIVHANHSSIGSDEGMASVADAAYGMADAMLKAREEE